MPASLTCHPFIGGAAVLSVIYRGKPTHHMMATTENSVTVNNKTYGTATTIEEVRREHPVLAQKGPKRSDPRANIYCS